MAFSMTNLSLTPTAFFQTVFPNNQSIQKNARIRIPLPLFKNNRFVIRSSSSILTPDSWKTSTTSWTPDSWKTKKVLQIPKYPEEDKLDEVLNTLQSYPPLVFAGEARKLEEKLADAAFGKAFLLQGGDCAESFKEFNGNIIRDTFRLMLQMGVSIIFGGQMSIIKVRLRSNLLSFFSLEKVMLRFVSKS